MKKVSLLIVVLMVLGVDVFAAGTAFTQLDAAGQAAADVAGSTFNSFRWVFALVPFAVGMALAGWVWNDQHKKSEMSQENTKLSTAFKTFGGFVAGVFVVFLSYGVFGTVFLNDAKNANGNVNGNSFTNTWAILVTDFWTQTVSVDGGAQNGTFQKIQ